MSSSDRRSVSMMSRHSVHNADQFSDQYHREGDHYDKRRSDRSLLHSSDRSRYSDDKDIAETNDRQSYRGEERSLHQSTNRSSRNDRQTLDTELNRSTDNRNDRERFDEDRRSYLENSRNEEEENIQQRSRSEGRRSGERYSLQYREEERGDNSDEEYEQLPGRDNLRSTQGREVRILPEDGLYREYTLPLKSVGDVDNVSHVSASSRSDRSVSDIDEFPGIQTSYSARDRSRSQRAESLVRSRDFADGQMNVSRGNLSNFEVSPEIARVTSGIMNNSLDLERSVHARDQERRGRYSEGHRSRFVSPSRSEQDLHRSEGHIRVLGSSADHRPLNSSFRGQSSRGQSSRSMKAENELMLSSRSDSGARDQLSTTSAGHSSSRSGGRSNVDSQSNAGESVT